MQGITEHANHLRHVIIEAGTVDNKVYQDIKLTMQSMCREATSGQKEVIKMWRGLYFDMKKRNELLEALLAEREARIRQYEGRLCDGKNHE